MIETIQTVEKQFKTIDAMVNTQSYGIQLKDPSFIEQLSIVVEEAYVSLNDGMCEEIKVCHTCSYQRNYLRNIMALLSELEGGGSISSTVKRELFTFPEKISEVLVRIEQALKELKS
jgi:glucosamine 6-phosphate synthetase-like amidotransferase/phosphosugar isomerase protein